MRILSIHYQNINSLDGEGHIDFDQGPLAESGVFAITGPNGSGKTSLLDVITLALYGETYRLQQPADHVMTQHASNSAADVTFALGDAVYQARWQLTRSAGSVASMQLQQLNGDARLLAEGNSAVRKTMTELTGLDFHSFCKAIVLPQGDFAAFLNALDSERLSILENISGKGLQQRFCQQTEATYQACQAQVADLSRERDSIPLLTPAALDAAQHDLQDVTDQHHDLTQALQSIEVALADQAADAALHQQHQQLLAKQQTLSQRLDQHRQQNAHLAAQADANRLRPALADYETQRAEQAQHQAALQAAQSQLAVLQQQQQSLGITSAPDTALGLSLATQQQVIDTLQQQINANKTALPQAIEAGTAYQQQVETLKASLADTRDWLAQHAADQSLLTNFPDVSQLRNLRSEVAELSAKQKSQSKSSKKTTDARQKNQSLTKTLVSKISQLQQQQQADTQALTTLAQGQTLQQLQALLDDQQQRVADFEALNALALTNARLSKKSFLGWFVGNQSLELPDEAALQQQVARLQDRYSAEENISNTLAMAISQEALIKKMTKERAQLVDGKPCFLCGSTKHPYLTKPPVLNDSKKALADQKGRLQALKLKLDAATKQLQAAQKTISQQSAKTKFLQQKRSEWAFLANRLNTVQSGLSIDNLALQKSLLAEETEALQRLQKLVASHQQLQANINAAEQERAAKQQLLDSVRVSAEQLDSTWAERSPEWLAVEQQLKHCQQAEKALTETLTAQLALFNEKLPGKNKENALFDRLNARRQDYQIRQLREQGVQTELNLLQEQLQQQQATVISMQQRLQHDMEQLRDAENIGLHLSIQACQQQISAHQSQLSSVSKRIADAEQALLSACTDNGIAGIAPLKELLRLLDEAPQRQQQHEALLAEQAAVEDSLAALAPQLASIADAAQLQASQETLLIEQRQLQQQREIAEQEVRRLEQLLSKQTHYQQRYDALSAELAVQTHALDQASVNYQLIHGDPAALRGNIQALLVEQLLTEANRILDAINGRYRLRSQLSSHGLGLEIEDAPQGVRRHPKTLSGGESFVVSLALALALAELSKNGRAIESLFLDEGFGNLDAEALYLALSALEGLPLQGKTVGIISHVEGVKKRIKTQIELIKKANGLSELRLVA